MSIQLSDLRKATQTQFEAIQILYGGLSVITGEVRSAQGTTDDTRRVRIWRRLSKRAWGARHALVLKSGLFDPDWYRRTYDIDTGIDALDHFIKTGSRRIHSPGPLFDAQWYIASNPDVAEHGLEPLIHYIVFGRREGRPPLRQLLPSS